VGYGDHFHVQERVFHWLTLELSGGVAVRLERVVRTQLAHTGATRTQQSSCHSTR
jgi:hypothetical protein